MRANCGRKFNLEPMATREDTLSRIRAALDRSPNQPASPRSLFPPLGSVLAPIPPDQVVARFEQELEKVSGCAHRAADPAQLEDILRKILADRQARSVVLSRNPLLQELGLAGKIESWRLAVESWSEPRGEAGETNAPPNFREHAFAAEVGITGVEFVLAESGSLVLTSLTEGAQLASLAPPAHIALYRRPQALATLEEVLERLPVPRDPEAPLPGRSVVFITGPSRTADIEQILIRGVHGPKEVHAILVEDACFD